VSRYDRGASNALDFASPAQLARNLPAPRPTPPPGPPQGVTESGSWRWVWVPDRPDVRDELQTACWAVRLLLRAREVSSR
jgi:hypothetical protein